MTALLEDDDLFRRTADNGYAVARELLNIDRTIESYKAIFAGNALRSHA